MCESREIATECLVAMASMYSAVAMGRLSSYITRLIMIGGGRISSYEQRNLD
jgi:hypothetical protein